MSQFVLDLAAEAGGQSIVSISRNNEMFQPIQSMGTSVLSIKTFSHPLGALNLFRLWKARRAVVDAIHTYDIRHVVVLMSHVWTPFLASAVKSMGVRYTVLVHDALPHPGDITARIHAWLMRDALQADVVCTLSEYVATAIRARYPSLALRVRVLFHPHLRRHITPAFPPQNLIGFLFFGRIMAYKGLPLFVEACELLRSRGHTFRVAVVGEGALGGLAVRLASLQAEVVNRWVDPLELDDFISRYSVVVCPNIEASQSGVIALAHGLDRPVIATPVGGLIEQIADGITGLLIPSVSAEALADAMQRFLEDSSLRSALREGLLAVRESRSMARFLEAIVLPDEPSENH